MDRLSKEVQESIRKNNGTYYDEATGTTYELGDSNYGAQSNNVGVTSQAKTTTQTISAKKAASNLTDAQMAQLKDGRTVTVKGTSYKMNGDNVVMTQTKNVGKLEYQASNFAKNALESGYQGLSTTGGNVKMAAGTLASTKTGDAADEIEQQIPLASQTLATVDIQSGVEYDLEDYSIMDEDQVNKSYSTIMSNAYGL